MRKSCLYSIALSAMLMVGCGEESNEAPSNDQSAATGECGNGTIESNEACDDGNTDSGDGCSATCEVEDGYTCPESGKCTKDEAPGDPEDPTDKPEDPTDGPKDDPAPEKLCGNSQLDDDESCDDGNDASGDGCSDACAIEDGYRCDKAGKPCARISCGNGKLDAYKGESCDDGNRIALDGCSPACQIERSWKCETDASGKSPCLNT